jgi:hypothetical protein
MGDTGHFILGGDDPAARRCERLCWLGALVLGLLQAWGRRHISADGLLYIGADSIAYLDQGDAWLRGDWATALNAMWSPLYPWFTGLTLHLFRPPPYQEFTVIRLLNFVIYCGALASFAYCLRRLIGIRGAHVINYYEPTDPNVEPENAPRRGWLAPRLLFIFGYAMFIWASLQMNRVSRISPDVLVTVWAYLAAGLVLRMKAGDARWRNFVLLGAVLGAGYLTKTVMFPLAFVWLACALCAGGRMRRALPRVVVALCVFLCIAAPFVVALSRRQQRLTIGDSARLNYAWYVNGVEPFTHWQGGGVGGRPLHPTRHVFTAPDVYEFAAPVGGTYPPWYDPTYWYAGVVTHFSLRQQLRAIAHNLLFILRFISARLFLYTVLLCLALLFYLSARGRRLLRDLAAYWVVLVPALAACCVYVLVNVEPRYLAPFFTLIALGLFAAVSPCADEGAARVLPATVWAVVLTCALSLAPDAARDLLATARDAVRGSTLYDAQWQVADELRRQGVPEGAPVAVVGDAMYAAWPRLARVRVVAELPAKPLGNVETFWAADVARRYRVLGALIIEAQAQVVVAKDVPRHALADGWQPLGATGYYYLPVAILYHATKLAPP